MAVHQLRLKVPDSCVQHTAVHHGQRVRYGQGGVGREADQIGQPAGAVHHVQVVIELGIGGGAPPACALEEAGEQRSPK